MDIMELIKTKITGALLVLMLCVVLLHPLQVDAETIQDGISIDRMLVDYDAEDLKVSDDWNTLIDYVHSSFLDQKGIVVLYTGNDYKEMTLSSVQELYESAIQIDDKNIISDGASLWGNIKSINKGFALTETGALLCVRAEYRNTKDELDRLDKELDRITKDLDTSYNLQSLSDEEKVKVIHNYMCDTFDYDTSYSNYTDYDGIYNKVNGKKVMVCQGYSIMTYKLLLKCGLNANVLISDTHSWNIVELNGLWYQMDVTNDDYGIYGQKNGYKYYLKASLNGEPYNYLNTTIFYKDAEVLYQFADKNYYDDLTEFKITVRQITAQIIAYTIHMKALVIPIIFATLIFGGIQLFITIWDKMYAKKRERSKKEFDLFNSI